jgi:hypothetical protein
VVLLVWCRHDTPQACAGGPILSLRRQPEVLAKGLGRGRDPMHKATECCRVAQNN